MNGYRLILSNPTPSPREMTIPAGRRLGISEGVVTTSQEVTIEIDSFTRLAIYYDAAGNRVLDRRTIDDINVIGEVEMIDVSMNGASIVPVEIDNSELNGSKASRDLFSARARDLCEGITEDADRRMGGSMLVAQLSYLRSQRHGQRVGIYSPAALNLRCDDGTDTLYSLMSAGDISLTTCVGNGYNRSGALELCVRNNTDTELRVRIPQGALFEQAVELDAADGLLRPGQGVAEPERHLAPLVVLEEELEAAGRGVAKVDADLIVAGLGEDLPRVAQVLVGVADAGNVLGVAVEAKVDAVAEYVLHADDVVLGELRRVEPGGFVVDVEVVDELALVSSTPSPRARLCAV